MAESPKKVFSRGEVAPLFHARSDLLYFEQALAEASNVYVHRLGGVSNRAGLRYRSPTRYHDKATRLLPFKFGEEDTHFVELGDQYARFTRSGSHIFDKVLTVTGVSQANPAVITVSGAHGMTNGDEIEVSAVKGMTELNNRRFIITSTGASTFSIADQLTGTNVDSSAFPAYVSGGTASRVYTISSPYLEADLFKIKYKQSFDIMTLTCEGYDAKELQRSGLTSWSFVDVSYKPDHDAPGSPSVTVGSAGAETFRYAVTAVKADTGEESLAALSSSTGTITGVTQANPAVITLSSAPGYETGHEVEISGVSGMTELNGRRFRLAKVTSTTYQLQGVDSSSFGAYTSGGTAAPAFVVASSSAATPRNTISFSPVAGSITYNIYREKNGVFGYLGSTSGAEYLDDGSVSPDTSDTVPFYRDPFLGSGNSPLTIGKYQQRNVYAGTVNAPLKVEFSKIGARKNLSSSNPIKADDAFAITIDGDEVNKPRHLVTGRDLMLFTNTAVHIINSSSDSGFSFSSVRQQQQADVGASDVAPISVDKWVLFVEDGGARVFAIQYKFSIDGYAPDEVSILSQHLFEDFSPVDWAFSPHPEPLIYCVLESGTLAILNFSPQEGVEVKGWTTAKTEGLFKSVASLREFPNDRQNTVAFVVKRGDYQFIEVLDHRDFSKVEECFFLDSGVTLDDAKALENVSGSVYTITGHGWVNGDQITVPGGLYFTVDSATTNTFELTGSDPSQYAVGTVFRRRQTQVSGLRHLAGASEVVALLDGNEERGITVSSEGLVTLPYAAAHIHIGIPYTSRIKTLRVPSFGQDPKGRVRKISGVRIDVLNSRGFFISVGKGAFSPWKQREFEAYGQPTQLATGFVHKSVDSTWDREGYITLEQRSPLPLTIRAIVPDLVE